MKRLLSIISLTFLISSYSSVNILFTDDVNLYGTGALGNVTISGSPTLANNGVAYQYENLTIPAGITLTLGSDGDESNENIIVIKVKNTLTLNGTIVGIYGGHPLTTVSTVINGINFQKSNPQQPGGYGGTGYGGGGGSGQSYGNGGGGGGGRGGGGGGPSVAYGGNGGYGAGCQYQAASGGGGGAGVYGNGGGTGGFTGPSECGSGGGGGGSRGYHGATVIIMAKKIVGNGYIDLHGSNGGGGGQSGSVSGSWNTGSYLGGGRGGSGGGGAGGNGGTVFFVSDDNSFNGSYNINPGSGGGGGSHGSGGNGNYMGGYGSGGSNGLPGSVIHVNLQKK